MDFSDISEVADEDDDKKMKEAMSSLHTLHTGEYHFDKIAFGKKSFTFNNLFRCLPQKIQSLFNHFFFFLLLILFL